MPKSATLEKLICSAAGVPGGKLAATFLEVIREVLGDYVKTTSLDVLIARDAGNVRVQEDVGRLRGVRMAVATEVESGKRFNEALVKRLTGGDQLKGGGLYQKGYYFTLSSSSGLV